MSRALMESWWSFQMLIGADSARLATFITQGSRMPDATKSISFMRASPWEAVDE